MGVFLILWNTLWNKILLCYIFNKYPHTKCMGYFNYHGKIKKLIDNGELERFEIVDEYHNISPAMILYFKNHAPMPVREHHFDEYLEIMGF